MATKGAPARGLAEWMPRATSSLPVPVSPSMSAVMGEAEDGVPRAARRGEARPGTAARHLVDAAVEAGVGLGVVDAERTAGAHHPARHTPLGREAEPEEPGRDLRIPFGDVGEVELLA